MKGNNLHIIKPNRAQRLMGLVWLIVLTSGLFSSVSAQTVIYSTGFETADLVGAAMPVWDVNGSTTTLTGTDGNCVRNTYSADWGLLSGSMDGVLAFYITTTAGKYYTVEVIGTEGPNKATIPVTIKTGAAGDRTTMAAGTTVGSFSVTKVNGCSADLSRWFDGSGYWLEATGGTVYVGFYFNQSFSGGSNNSRIHYDNIVVTEHDDPPCQSYCTVAGDLATPGEITNVIFNTINNTTSWDGYVCTGVGTTVQLSSTHDLKVTRLNNATYNLRTAAWIDWNRDGDFSDAGENVMTNLNNTTAGSVQRTVSVSVPAGATIGVTKMRVVMKYNADLTGPCDPYTSYMDWEDYDITVEAGAPSSITFYNTGGATQLAFNNSKLNDNTPLFRASAISAGAFTDFFVEVNTKADFTGTAYTQTISGAYASTTQYDLDCNSLSTALPTTDGVTYYVRAKASDDNGSTWGSWSSGTYSFTYKTSGNADWFQTTTEQFDTDAASGLSVASNSVTKTSGGTYLIDDDMEYASDAAFEADWTVTEESTNVTDPSTTQAVSGSQSIKFTDTQVNGGGNNYTDMEKTFAVQTAFTAEFSIYLTTTADEFQVELGPANPSMNILFDFYNGNMSYYDGGFTNVSTYSINTWYNIKIVADCATDLMEVFVDGTSVGSGLNFASTATDIGRIGFTTLDISAGVFYVDDVKVYTGSPAGTITSTSALFASFDGATSWNEAIWSETGGTGDFTVTVQENSAGWADVAGMVDIDVSPIDISSLTTEAEIRLVGTFTYSGGAPTTTDWTLSMTSAIPGNAFGVYASDAVVGANVSDDEITTAAGNGNEYLVSSNGADDGYTSVAISAYPIITTEPFNCTGVDLDFTTASGSPDWTALGTGATPATSTASPATIQYSATSTGRKDIVENGSTYTGFVNITLDAPTAGAILGTAAECPGTYNFSSPDIGSPGYSFLWTVVDPGNGTSSIATATAGSSDIDFTNASSPSADITFTVELVVSTECCGPLPKVTKVVTIYLDPDVPSLTNQSTCIGGSQTLSVNSPDGTYNYDWYTVATGGAPFSSGTSYTQTPVSAGAATAYIEATSANGCPSVSRGTVTLTGTDTPPVVADPSSGCAEGYITMSVTGPVAGATYTWYSDAGLTTVLQSGVSTTYDAYVAGPAPNSTTVYVTVTESGCSESTDDGTPPVASITASPASVTWNGGTDSDWFTATNWTPNCVPTQDVNVLIPNAGVTNECEIDFTVGLAEAYCKDFTIESGRTIELVDNKAVLNVYGDWTNDAATTAITSTGPGVIVFEAAIAQVIDGTSSTVFGNITIANSSSTGVTLNISTSVSIDLSMSDGIVYTNAANTLDVLDNATSNGGNVGSFVDGPIKKIGNEAFVFPIGDGATWARMAISAPTTATTEYTAQYYAAGYGTYTMDPGAGLNNVSVMEYWNLDQAVNDDDVQVRLYWENSAISGITDCDGTPDDLRVVHWSTGNSRWEVDVNTVTLNGGCPSAGWAETNGDQPSYSPFTFASKSSAINPLPIKLLYFDAEYNSSSSNVDLSWATASETNNHYFTIEKSKNGTDFQMVEQVPGAGTSSSLLLYDSEDENPYDGLSYYRLKQTDYDGQFEYSDIVAVNILKGLNFGLRPNPATDKLELTFGNISGKSVFVMTPEYNAELNIYDTRGKLVYHKEFDGTFYKFTIDISRFDQGLYVVALTANDERYKAKFVKE